MAELYFIEGPLTGERKLIDQQVVTFGRSKSSDIRLPDDTKSIGRTHFSVARVGDDLYVVDNNSVNGTWLNGKRIGRAKLSDGDQVRAGAHLIRFAIQKKEHPQPIAASQSQEKTGATTPGATAQHVFIVRSELETVPNREYETRQLAIGRGLENDVVLHDGYVGRRHATIEWTSGGYVVRDNRSQQGTTVNGIRVVSREVSDGDVIGIGTYLLTAEETQGGLKLHLRKKQDRSETIVIDGKTVQLVRPETMATADRSSDTSALTAPIPIDVARALDLEPHSAQDSILDAYLSLESEERRARPPRWVPTSDYEKPWRARVSILVLVACTISLGVILALIGTVVFVPHSLSSKHLAGTPDGTITTEASSGSCSSCHTPFFGVDLNLCNQCHTAPVSSKHANARLNCLDCHTEHKGEDFQPAQVALVQCTQCHDGQYRFTDSSTQESKVLPIPHGGREMGYPVQDGVWQAVALKEGSRLPEDRFKEEFHLLHTQASVSCGDCHLTTDPIDRETPEHTCKLCHGGAASEPGLARVRCTSCHAQHGDHKEELFNAKNFSLGAWDRPWDSPEKQPVPSGPVKKGDLASASSYNSLVPFASFVLPALLGFCAVPLAVFGALYVSVRRKRNAYATSLAAVATQPLETKPPPTQEEWGGKGLKVERADQIIKKGKAALAVTGTVVIPNFATTTGPIPEDQIPKDHPHPIVDVSRCVGCKDCVEACPFNVFDLVNGKAVVTRLANCMGDTVCAVVCPTYAIQIKGVDKVVQTAEMPNISDKYETNVSGLYCIGDLTSLPLIKNAINMGKDVIDTIVESKPSGPGKYDVVIVGVGPAGLSATLSAQSEGLSYIALEQGETANTIRNYPRQKLVLAEPIPIALHGQLDFREGRKEDIIELWDRIIKESGVQIRTGQKVERLSGQDGDFVVETATDRYAAKKVILAIGKRGTPRKLGATGEDLPKVTYNLVDAAAYQNNHVLIVGGGDSALEAALALATQGTNTVTLSYRRDSFSRAKSRNVTKIKTAIRKQSVRFIPNSSVTEIRERDVVLKTKDGDTTVTNDYVIVMIGGEVPKPFLEKAGIEFARRPLTVA